MLTASRGFRLSPPEAARARSRAAASPRARSCQEPVYAARVPLDRTRMQIDDNLVNLLPGMAVTAEIKTGSRTVISYLLSPLIRYKHESLRER